MLERIYHTGLLVSWLAIAGTFVVLGSDYYQLPSSERAFLDQHAVYKPAGTTGMKLGIAGSIMMVVGVGMYSTRKRMARFRHWGKLRHWLSFHIFLCTLGPFLIMLHTSFRVGGLVAISFWSMVLVVLSGIVGRYIYVHLPKTLQGQIRTQQSIRKEQSHLLDTLHEQTGWSDEQIQALLPAPISQEKLGLIKSLAVAVRSDWASRQQLRQTSKALKETELEPALQETLLQRIRQHQRLSQQMALLKPFQRMFRYWHTFHLPFAIVMFLVMVVHIGVAIAFGYAWQF